jgi:hypothetical protein
MLVGQHEAALADTVVAVLISLLAATAGQVDVEDAKAAARRPEALITAGPCRRSSSCRLPPPPQGLHIAARQQLPGVPMHREEETPPSP